MKNMNELKTAGLTMNPNSGCDSTKNKFVSLSNYCLFLVFLMLLAFSTGCSSGGNKNESYGETNNESNDVREKVSQDDIGKVGVVTNRVTGRVWMDRNLGAKRVATSSTDAEAYGDLYQWGRAADGHQKRNSAGTTAQSSKDNPGHGDFIYFGNPFGVFDWRSPQNDELWQGVNGTNNPCPEGFRIPTEEEWKEEIATWSKKNAEGAFASPLKLPMAGCRFANDGKIDVVGTLGYYWSSTISGSNTHDGADSRRMSIVHHSARTNSATRNHGLSVRCIKD
jgi:uncharacterized protein (TIGR02145 family)